MSNLSPQFDNVVSLDAARSIKQATGQARAIRQNTPESSEFASHADQALAIHNEPVKKKSMSDKFWEYLGL